MDKELFKEYAEVRAQIAKLSELEESIKSKMIDSGILKELEANKDAGKTIYGTFTLTKRNAWKFTEEVTKLKEAMEIRMEDEKEKGLALCTETKSFSYEPAK